MTDEELESRRKDLERHWRHLVARWEVVRVALIVFCGFTVVGFVAEAVQAALGFCD